MKNHEEKQRIFDEYSQSQGYESFDVILEGFVIGEYVYDEFKHHLFNACDLVQKEALKKASESAKVFAPWSSSVHNTKNVNKDSITDEKNLIK